MAASDSLFLLNLTGKGGEVCSVNRLFPQLVINEAQVLMMIEQLCPKSQKELITTLSAVQTLCPLQESQRRFKEKTKTELPTDRTVFS